MKPGPSQALSQCCMRPVKPFLARVWRVAAAVVLIASIAGGELRAQTPLAWAFQKGDILRYKIHYKAETTLKPGSGFESGFEPGPDLEVILAWTVTQVDPDGKAEVAQKVEHVREQARDRSGEGPMLVYDSADPKSVNNAWSSLKEVLYRPVLGATYTLTIDRRGDVTNIKLPDHVLKGFDEAHLQPRDSHDFLFTQAGLEALFNLMPRLPEGPMAAGTPWQSRRTSTEGIFQNTLVEDYTSADRAARADKFEARPKLTVQLLPQAEREKVRPARGTIIPLIAVKVEEQLGQSVLTFDRVAGRLTSFSRKHRYQIKSTLKAPSNSKKTSSDPPTDYTTITESEVEIRSLPTAS